jgi:glycosyltransferase involved in cell wall biosynthesis
MKPPSRLPASGLNLHVYPSEMVQESRIFRISRALQDTGLFGRTELVGIVGEQPEGVEPLDEGRVINRLGADGATADRFGARVRSRLGWFGSVVSHYACADVAVVNAHSVWTLPSCWALARRTGARLVYSTHELETETPTMVGKKKRVAQLIERGLIRHCDLVTVVNTPIADWYTQTYRIPRPVVARNIPVGTSREPVALREQLDLGPDERLFIHTGRITDGRHVEQILAAFVDGPPDVHVVFLGDGELRALVEQAASRCPRVHWLPPVPHNEVVAHVAAADVSLCLIDTTTLSYRLSTPNKLFEALSARTPVLCSDLPGAAEFIGPQLWPQWHVTDVARQLPEALRRIDRPAIDHFRETLAGLPSWEDEVAPLVSAYRRVVAET